MAMSIRTNVASLNAQHALFNAGNDLNKSMQRLSTGFRINSSADDAAGMAISTKMQSQIGGLNQAAMNAQDGISMIQTAEGALDEVTSSLQRMRDLSVQAANATLSDGDRANINKEVQALFTNINNIASRTQFNGQNLLTGALSTSQDTAASTLLVGAISTGAGAASISEIDLSRADAGATGATAYTFTSDSAAGTLTLTHSSVIGGVQHTASQTVSVGATAAGATQTVDFSTLGVKFTVTGGTSTLTAGALIAAVDGTELDTTAGTSVAAFQVGADANQTESAAFFDVRINSTNDNAALNTAITNFGQGSTVANANALNSAIDGMISTLVSKRAALGASQNSLQHTMNNLRTASDNLSASNSRIRDVDVAAESSAMTRAQIISQSAVSVLAQANQMPQLALKLLG